MRPGSRCASRAHRRGCPCTAISQWGAKSSSPAARQRWPTPGSSCARRAARGAPCLRPPRFGAKVISFDASKAKALPGVVDVVQIPRGVAVVGRDMWSARKGREALSVTWDESGAEKRGTAELMKQYRALARGKEAVTVVQAGGGEAGLGHAGQRGGGEVEDSHL